MTELTPDQRLRGCVLASGVVLNAAGIVLIATLPVAGHWRSLAAALWGLHGVREILLIARGYKRCRRIRIAGDGGMQLLLPQGEWVAVELLPGSVVLQNLAWLRFRFPDGSRGAELLRSSRRQNEAWRRFQLIWRHLGGER